MRLDATSSAREPCRSRARIAPNRHGTPARSSARFAAPSRTGSAGATISAGSRVSASAETIRRFGSQPRVDRSARARRPRLRTNGPSAGVDARRRAQRRSRRRSSERRRRAARRARARREPATHPRSAGAARTTYFVAANGGAARERARTIPGPAIAMRYVAESVPSVRATTLPRGVQRVGRASRNDHRVVHRAACRSGRTALTPTRATDVVRRPAVRLPVGGDAT